MLDMHGPSWALVIVSYGFTVSGSCSSSPRHPALSWWCCQPWPQNGEAVSGSRFLGLLGLGAQPDAFAEGKTCFETYETCSAVIWLSTLTLALLVNVASVGRAIFGAWAGSNSSSSRTPLRLRMPSLGHRFDLLQHLISFDAFSYGFGYILEHHLLWHKNMSESAGCDYQSLEPTALREKLRHWPQMFKRSSWIYSNLQILQYVIPQERDIQLAQVVLGLSHWCTVPD